MHKYNTLKFFGLMAILVMMTGCALSPKQNDDYIELDQKQSEVVINRIVVATNRFNLAKCKADIVLDFYQDGKKERKKVNLTLLWAPGQALRAKLHSFRVSLLALLFVDDMWYIANEMESVVYLCHDLTKVEISNFPKPLLQEIACIPNGWLASEPNYRKVFVNDFTVKIVEGNKEYSKTIIFPKDSAIPNFLAIKLTDGSALSATFSKPITNLVIREATFKPNFANYKQIKLDI